MADKSFEALWKHFVPRDGPPRNAAGEALRAVARIGHEINVNEGASWEPDHDAAAELIGRNLAAEPLLEAAELEALRRDVKAIRDAGAAQKAGSEGAKQAYGRVRGAVVTWCNRRLTRPSE